MELFSLSFNDCIHFHSINKTGKVLSLVGPSLAAEILDVDFFNGALSLIWNGKRQVFPGNLMSVRLFLSVGHIEWVANEQPNFKIVLITKAFVVRQIILRCFFSFCLLTAIYCNIVTIRINKIKHKTTKYLLDPFCFWNPINDISESQFSFIFWSETTGGA